MGLLSSISDNNLSGHPGVESRPMPLLVLLPLLLLLPLRFPAFSTAMAEPDREPERELGEERGMGWLMDRNWRWVGVEVEWWRSVVVVVVGCEGLVDGVDWVWEEEEEGESLRFQRENVSNIILRGVGYCRGRIGREGGRETRCCVSVRVDE